jgi:3-dehydroquinate dehydratase
LFQIYDGRSQFYQWDIDRKLIVEDAEITQVHFCNRTGDCSLVCETYVEDGLTLVNVPNILLQTDWRINVYAYDRNYTKFSKQFDVVRRSKPESYVYTETEILNYQDLLDKMTAIENDIGEVVEDYVKEHGIVVDLEGYATEEYVNEAIAAIDIPEADVDLSDYYTKSETDAAISEAIGNLDISDVDVDLSNYYTKEETNAAITDAIGNLDIPEADVDLTGYATEDYVISKINEIELAPDRTGVYVGDEEPTDPFVNVWIDTLGEAQIIPAEGGKF